MKERINKLAKGIVELDFPELKLSGTSFDGVVQSGETGKFELVLTSENGVQLKGLLYSDNAKVSVKKSAFGGIRTRIACEVNTENLRDKDTIKGELELVSNAGERRIPYSFAVKSYASAEIISTLHTAQDFSKLFSEEEELALRVFDYDDFYKAGFMSDARTRTIYEGLKASPDRRLAAIEFLRALKASPVLPEATDAEGEVPVSSIIRVMPVKKSKAQQESANASALQPLYPEEIEDAALIEKAAAICIREGVTGGSVYKIYQKAIENGSKITRLYDYYLYALPRNFSDKMPREVYLYFAYESSIDENLKLPLYYNVLLNFAPETDIYKRFERQIQEYAIANMLDSKINARLALIYDRMILPEMIDEHIASVFPAILRSFRVSTDDRRVSYVVVRFLELKCEEIFPLRDGVAYLPLFFENSVLLFQDAYGNRYTEVAYQKAMIMNKPNLEKKCFEVYPEHPMLRLAAVRRIARNGIQNHKQLVLVENVLDAMDISSPYRDQLVSVVLHYHDLFTKEKDQTITEYDLAFLKTIPLQALRPEEKQSLIHTLIRLDCLSDAAAVLFKSGLTELEFPYFEKLISDMILHCKDADERVLVLAWHLFVMGSKKKELVEFLLENYNGMSEDMLRILKRGIEIGCDGAKMCERLLAQMIFTRNTNGIDYVYDYYRTLPDNEEMLIRAYASMKSIDYFIYGKGIPEKVFGDISTLVRTEPVKDRVPTIYMLALSRHMAEAQNLTSDEKLLLQDIMDVLLPKKLIFAYTPRLARFIHLPDYVVDKVYIEYHGSKTDKPTLLVRMLPDEEGFHEEEFEKVYQNIYVRPMILFSGETAEYRIFEADASDKPAEKGSLKTQEYHRALGDTYDILNEMSALMGTDKDRELKESMLRYVRNESVIEELFTKEK